MPSFNKINLKSFVFSFLLSTILTLVIFFTLQSFSIELSLEIILITFCALVILTFTLIFLYLKFVIENRIKDIYKSIIPENDSIENKLVSTDMEDLIQQLKTFSKENQIEIKSMQEKENFRRNFIGNLAHELKTPLFTSQSYLLTLIDGAIKDKNVNIKYLKIAEKAVQRLIFIVKDLDLITKLESDNMKIKLSNFNIISIINNVFEMLEIQASKKNISLLIDSKINKTNVLADQEKIHQVLTNLIENSIKYGKKNGTTEISVENLIDNKLLVRITDNGKGIKKEHFERLFERFYRVESSGSRSTGGSGLGLAIVKHIIDAHNEKIYVESDFGVGSEFSFSIEKSK